MWNVKMNFQFTFFGGFHHHLYFFSLKDHEFKKLVVDEHIKMKKMGDIGKF